MKTASPSRRVPARGLRRLAVTLAVIVLALIIAWTLFGAPSAPKLLAGSIVAVPLAAALPGLRAGDRRTFAWSTLASVPPLVLAMTEAVANPAARAWALSSLCAVFALFTLLIVYLRATRAVT